MHRRSAALLGLLIPIFLWNSGCVGGDSGTSSGSVPAVSYSYVARTGSDDDPGTFDKPWLTIQKAADTLKPGEGVLIRAGTYAERVTPRNSGLEGRQIVYSSYGGETVTIDGTGIDVPTDEGLFHIAGRSHLKVCGLTIANSGYAGLYVTDSSAVVLQQNHTVNTSSSGIGVWSSKNVQVDGNEVERACSNGMQEMISVAGTDIFEVSNNHVHNEVAGYLKEGICLKDGSSNGTAHHNHVHHAARVGIYVDAWDKHTFNIQVFSNLVHDCGTTGLCVAGEMGGLLEHVSLHDNISHHNGTVGIWVSGCCPEAPTPVHPMNDIKIVNNTVVANGLDPWGGGIGLENPNARNLVIRNNLCSQNLTFQMAVDASNPAQNVVVDHNLIDGFRGSEGETRGSSFVEGDPLFVSPGALDFHLQAASPAVDAGASDDAPAFDHDGNRRPSSTSQRPARFDIGAYERQGVGLASQGSRWGGSKRPEATRR